MGLLSAFAQDGMESGAFSMAGVPCIDFVYDFYTGDWVWVKLCVPGWDLWGKAGGKGGKQRGIKEKAYKIKTYHK